MNKATIFALILTLQAWTPALAAPSTSEIERASRQHICAVEAAGEASLELRRAQGRVVLAEALLKSLEAELRQASTADKERLNALLEQTRQELAESRAALAEANANLPNPSQEWSKAAEHFARSANRTRARLHQHLDDSTKATLKRTAREWEVSRREFQEAEQSLLDRYRDLEEAEERIQVWTQRLEQARRWAQESPSAQQAEKVQIATNELERWTKERLDARTALESQKNQVAEAGARVRKAAAEHHNSIALAEAVAGAEQPAQDRGSRVSLAPKPAR